MRQRTFRLSEADANALSAAYLHCRHVHTKIRYQAVRLYGLGYSAAQIQDICGCSRASLMNWTRVYQEHGLAALVDARQGGNRARLSGEQREALQNQLHRYTPAQLLGQDKCHADGQFWCVPDLATLLARDYQVAYQSRTSLRNLLRACALSYQRPAKQYKSHSDHKVMDFEEQLKKNPRCGCKRAQHYYCGRRRSRVVPASHLDARVVEKRPHAPGSRQRQPR